MADPDVVLMLAFRDGDYDAFGTLVDRYGRQLVNYFYFQCRDMDRAEDCAQEVWVRIFRARSEYSPKARFRTFLFRVARNYWIDVYRASARRVQETSLDSERGEADGRESGPLARRLASDAPEPPREVEDEELVTVLARAVARLSEEMQEVFLLGAPVEVGDDAYLGAGTTVTKNVPAGALATSRSPMKMIEGWVERFRTRKRGS